MNHKHIVKFFSYFEDSENVYMILELCRKKVCTEILNCQNISTLIRIKILSNCPTFLFQKFAPWIYYRVFERMITIFAAHQS